MDLINILTKDFLIEEYINKNKSTSQIADEIGCGKTSIKNYIKKYGLNKSKEKINESLKNTNIKKYGCEYSLQNKEIIEKRYKTNIKKYGNKIPSKNKDCIEKMKQTNIKKYGVPAVLQNKNIYNKKEDTCLKKYGKKHYSQTDEFKEKCSNTMLNKFNSTNIFDSDYFKNKMLSNYGEIYFAKTQLFKIKTEIHNIEKYGVPYYTQTNEWKEKYQNTCLKKYGVENYAQSNDFKIKNKKTRIEKGLLPFVKKELYEIFLNKEILKKWISSHFVSKPTINDIYELTGYNISSIRVRIHELDADDLVDLKPITSKYEDEIIKILKSFGITNIIQSARILNGKEIDIYLPDYNFGIEFNGNYWHSELYKEYNYHQEKSILAENNGIYLYHIFEYEWKNEILKNKIIMHLKDLLQINIIKIYARKCIVKEISSSEKSLFLNNNHLQGDDKSSIHIGLYYNDELLSVMTFGKARTSQKCDYELFRYCVKYGYCIVGGASKLFKYFENNYLNIIDTTVVVYDSINKSYGNIYSILGFKLNEISKPNYIWYDTKTQSIKTKYMCNIKNETKTMKENNCIRIFDSGKKVWIYTKNFDFLNN